MDYDRILKESISGTIDILIRKIIKIPIVETEQISTDLPMTDERKPDFLVRVDSVEGSKSQTPFIIHLEFQSTNDPLMHYRMLRYRSFISQKYKIPLRQYVIFIGNQNVGMQNYIIDDNLIFKFDIIDLREIDGRAFLESNKPEEIILALLCKPLDGDRRLTIRLILDNLKAKVSGELGFGKYANQLMLLSRLRKAYELVKGEIENMALTFDFDPTTDPLYLDGLKKGMLQGLEQGERQGLEEGIHKGLEQGEHQTRIETAKQMKMDKVPLEKISLYTGLSISEIESL